MPSSPTVTPAQSSASATLTAALDLIARGMPVFPLKPHSKEPATTHGVDDASLDGGVAHRRFASGSKNLAVACKPWGFVIDSDGPPAKVWVQEQEAKFGPLPKTWMVKTSRGGHRYFRSSTPIPNIAKGQIAPEVEIKGITGGYVVAPPSTHPDGHVYEWLIGPREMPQPAEAPAWLVDLLLQHQAEKSTRAAEPVSEIIPDGQRNSTLASLAGTMRRRNLSESAIVAALLEENAIRCRPPLDEAEVRKIAKSVMRYPVALDDGEVRKTPTRGSAKKKGSDIAVRVAAAIEPKRIDYLWPGRIARGKLTAIGGDPGVGKGTLGIDICARLSTGRDWPDGQPAPFGKTQLLTGEDDPADTIIPRLMVAGADLHQVELIGQVLSLEPGEGPRRLDLSLDAELLIEQAARRGVVAIVIDPLSSYLGQETNSWRDSDMRRMLDPLAEAAARHHVAIVLVAHLTKANGSKALYRFQGSIATTAAARFGFLVAKHTTDPELRVFAAVKANLSHIPPSLSFRIIPIHLPAIDDEVGRLEWAGVCSLSADELLGPHERSRAVDAAKEFLLQYLAAGEARSNDAKAAARGHGIGKQSLWDAKGELGIIARKDGLGQWLWQLPDRDASPRIEPSRSDRDASGRFNSNGGGSYGSNEKPSLFRTVPKRPNHPGIGDGSACEHANVSTRDGQLFTCSDCGLNYDPSQEWPA